MNIQDFFLPLCFRTDPPGRFWLDENTRSSHEERTEREKDKEKKGKTERSAAEERTVEKRRVFTRLSSCCYLVIRFFYPPRRAAVIPSELCNNNPYRERIHFLLRDYSKCSKGTARRGNLSLLSATGRQSRLVSVRRLVGLRLRRCRATFHFISWDTP